MTGTKWGPDTRSDRDLLAPITEVVVLSASEASNATFTVAEPLPLGSPTYGRRAVQCVGDRFMFRARRTRRRMGRHLKR
jgi:hypothetical protein